MKKLCLFALIGFMAGCKKETAVKPLPAIQINTPNSNQHFVKGETIHISGTVSHSKGLTEVAVHMTDISTKIEFFHNHFSAGNAMNFNYDSNYLIPDNTKTSLKVEVEASDEEGTTATKEITVTIN